MNENQTSQILGKEKISKLMLKFSIPCVLSLLVSALYNIVDQIFIGNSELSTLGNAATGVVFPIFIIAQAFAWCFGDGCAACGSRVVRYAYQYSQSGRLLGIRDSDFSYFS